MSAYHLGGLLLFGRDYKDANGDWLTEDDFTAGARVLSGRGGHPAFHRRDEEGGTVTRAEQKSEPLLRTSPLPAGALCRGGLDGLLERTLSYNQKLKAFGVNVNFAPVCDVSTNPDNFIYARSFGQDAQTTRRTISQASCPSIAPVRRAPAS